MSNYDRVIIGIDPGTNLMGYGIVGITGKKAQMVAMGVLNLSKFDSHYTRLRRIYDRVLGLVDQYLPDEMAIEAPFFGKNVQSMLKLGRAQGVAIAAALARQVPITEYEPRTVKMAITGNGAAAKEQVREMLKRILTIPPESLQTTLDATDALAVAMCHFYESSKPGGSVTGMIGGGSTRGSGARHSSSWADFVAKNPDRLAK